MFAVNSASVGGAVHFVGFRDDRYWNAVKIWGRPDYFHIVWDRYARHEIAPRDTVVFAIGESDQPVRSFGGPDFLTIKERNNGGRGKD